MIPSELFTVVRQRLSVLVVMQMVTGTSLVAADDALWHSYTEAARAADQQQDNVTAARAWQAAYNEATTFRTRDPRIALSASFWALTVSRLSNQEQTRTALNTAAGLIEQVDPTPSTAETPEPRRPRSVEVQDARGIFEWAKARSHSGRPTIKVADGFQIAVDLIDRPEAPARRRAELLIESALAQRGVGRPVVAATHAALAVTRLREAQLREAVLGEALVLSALFEVELGRLAAAQSALRDWTTLDEELRAHSKPRPADEAAFRFVSARVALGLLDNDTARDHLAYFHIGQPEERFIWENPLLRTFDVLEAVFESEMQLCVEDQTTLLARLKTTAGADLEHRGRALRHEGDAALAAGRVHEALRAYRESVTATKTALGAEHPALAPALAAVAFLEVVTGDESNAAKSAHRALDVTSGALPASHPHRVLAWESQTRVELWQQHAGEAARLSTDLVERALTSWPARDPRVTELQALLTDALSQNRDDNALTVLQQAESADFAKLPRWRQGLAEWHLGRAWQLRGDSNSAALHYRAALQAFEACADDSKSPHPFAAGPLLGLAVAQSHATPQEPPCPEFNQAVLLYRQLYSNETGVALELNRQGNAFFSAHRFSEAAWLYDRSVALYLQVQGTASSHATLVQEHAQLARKRLEESVGR